MGRWNIAGKLMDNKIVRKILEQEGFEKRGVYDEPRLSEIIQMYNELGFEVLVVDYEKSLDSVCSTCLDEAQDNARYKVVYTKKR